MYRVLPLSILPVPVIGRMLMSSFRKFAVSLGDPVHLLLNHGYANMDLTPAHGVGLIDESDYMG